MKATLEGHATFARIVRAYVRGETAHEQSEPEYRRVVVIGGGSENYMIARDASHRLQSRRRLLRIEFVSNEDKLMIKEL